MKYKLLLYFILCLLFLFIIALIPNISADTIHVGSGYEYSSIQNAIDSANKTDTIYVHSGTYLENIVIDEQISLSGENKENTIITGDEEGDIIQVTADNVTIMGFTIKDTIGEEYKCIRTSNVINCRIQDNMIENANDGIYVLNSENTVIKNNIIKDHESDGILLYMSSTNEIESNKIQNNGVNGISIQVNSNSNTISKNIITLNSNYGVSIDSNSNNNIFYENDFTDNGGISGNAKDLGSNFWSYNSKGNYWDDYQDYDSDNDGFGDSPYNVYGDIYDNHPLGYFLNEEPTAYIISISPNPAAEGQTITFIGQGSDDGSIIEYEWKAGNQKISSQEEFTYSSLSGGTYEIKFRVRDNKGTWSEYDTDTLTIRSPSDDDQNKMPKATIVTISPNSAEYKTKIYFSGNGNDEDGYIAEYYWSSNKDGFLSSNQSFYRSDLSTGSHIISFKVKDNDNSWSNTDTHLLTITSPSSDNENNPPVAHINSLYTNYVNSTIAFNASQSYDPDNEDSIISYIWYFGDENSKSGEIVEHIYQKPGNYTVKLTVTDSYGASDNETTMIKINPETNTDLDENNDKKTPGFLLIFLISSILLVFFFRKIKEII